MAGWIIWKYNQLSPQLGRVGAWAELGKKRSITQFDYILGNHPIYNTHKAHIEFCPNPFRMGSNKTYSKQGGGGIHAPLVIHK